MTDLETILERVNLNRAFKEVVANKGSAGVDGMGVKDLRAHLRSNGAELVRDIKEATFLKTLFLSGTTHSTFRTVFFLER